MIYLSSVEWILWDNRLHGKQKWKLIKPDWVETVIDMQSFNFRDLIGTSTQG